MRVWLGKPYPLGATWDGEGTNFALYSENATAVELCLFDRPYDAESCEQIALRDNTKPVWHAYLPGVRPGQLYGYRVSGPYAPHEGHHFNPAKLLADPYAKAMTGAPYWSDALFGYSIGSSERDLRPNLWDSAGFMMKCVVLDSSFPWGSDAAPRTPWSETVIYECHVKGMTMQHPDVSERLRGTYLGLASQPVIEHLQGLGVTAVELLPVHQLGPEQALSRRGLSNYWGYNSLGFFAPDARFATGSRGEQVREFKSMVKGLHRAGIEVILDVVYNHTAEGGCLGPTLCLRGIDNATYYWLDPNDRLNYLDYTGCGNSLDVRHERTLQLIMDSLRYWVEEMHVDGFRFDLAPGLAREEHGFNRRGRFFATVQQDPILAQVKLIAEPWDLGLGGYQVGNFPRGWAEWNCEYRDTLRRFWKGDGKQIGSLASRLAGSADLYAADNRGPSASINFVTCHDGFSLRDLVSHNEKHNELNGEENRDGNNTNWSRNWGTEGLSGSVRIQNKRDRIKRNFFATLAFSQGVPMISHGDELGRTQRGNNNAYCQDNRLSWIDWDLDTRDRELLAFVGKIFSIRRANAVFRRGAFFSGSLLPQVGAKDISWLRGDGEEMGEEDWQDPDRFVLGMLTLAEATDVVDQEGRLLRGDTTLLLMNGGAHSCRFQLPLLPQPGRWKESVNTARPGERMLKRDAVHLVANSLILLTHRRPR